MKNQIINLIKELSDKREDINEFLNNSPSTHSSDQVFMQQTRMDDIDLVLSRLNNLLLPEGESNHTADSKQVSSEEHELQSWGQKFGATNDGIRVAKIMVGESVNSVEEFIYEKRHEGKDVVIPFDKLYLPISE